MVNVIDLFVNVDGYYGDIDLKAAVITRHGTPDSVEIKEIANPIPKKNKVLVKVMATTITSGDSALLRMNFIQFLLMWPIARLFFGVKNQRKKILGHEFSGEIIAIGENVTTYKLGDYVLGTTGFAGGAHAEYICLSADSVMTLKPETLSFEHAAALPIGSVCALSFLKTGKLQKGENVLIYGASGSIGTYAVQLAKHFGAHVTGVCSTGNVDLIKSLGANNVIDYKKMDFTQSDETYDLVFDTVGKISRSRCKRVLTKNGRFISSHSTPIHEKVEDLRFLKELVQKGAVKPVIDQQFSFEKISKAFGYVSLGHKKGNVVIKMNHDDDN